MADEHDEGGAPKRSHQARHPDAIPDYSFIPRDEIDRYIERRVRELTAQFVSEERIVKLIDQRTAQRWRNNGLPQSANPYEPGEPEDRVARMMRHLFESTEDATANKGKIARRMMMAAAILGGFGTFFGTMYLLTTALLAHLK